jgi:hypothetical protein
MKKEIPWRLNMNVRVGDRLIQHYTKCYGCKSTDSPPEEKIAIDGKIVFNQKGWSVNFFDEFTKIAGFVCIGWDSQSGHHLYKSSESVEILNCPELLSGRQYWKAGMFVYD